MNSLLLTADILKAKLNVLETGPAVHRNLYGLKEINQEPDKWRIDPTPTVDGSVRFDEIDGDISNTKFVKPKYHVGQVVYLREAWQIGAFKYQDWADINFRLDHSILRVTWNNWLEKQTIYGGSTCSDGDKWRSPYAMSEKLARHFVKVLSAGIGRLQNIGGAGGFGNLDELHKEGLLYGEGWVRGNAKLPMRYNSIAAFKDLWDSIYPLYLYKNNPWVFRYEIEKTVRPK